MTVNGCQCQQHQEAQQALLPHGRLAGQQESKVESLESIHAARMRSNSEAGTSTQAPTQPAAAPAQSALEDATASFHVVGEQEEEDSDPYNLPVSHEVALEGQSLPCHMSGHAQAQHWHDYDPI